MLLCRRLLRAHASNSASSPLYFRYRYANHVTRESFPKAAPQLSDLSDPGPALLERVLRVSRYSVPRTAKGSEPVAKQVTPEETKHSPFDAFTELRAQNHALSASLPTDVLCRLAEGAVKHGSQDIVDSLTADVLDNHLLLEEQRAGVAASLLCVPHQYPGLLDKGTTLSLLTIFRRYDHLFALPAPAALHVMKVLVHDVSLDTLDRPLMNYVLPPFLRHLASLRPPTGVKVVSYRPPETVSFAYVLTDTLVSAKWYREAFQVFQTLSDCGHIPVEAFLTEVPSPLVHDFSVIVRSTLARACLHWDWCHRGVGFIASVLKSQESLKRDLEPLAVELLHAALENCSSVQFKACAWLMCRLVDLCDGIAIPAQTVRLFYSRAMRVGDCEAAHLFYSHTQSRRVKRVMEYSLPQGPALTWLMGYLAGHQHDVHLARSLAKQVVDMKVPIPLYDRGRFIALAASKGFATEARALWERYAVGSGRKFVAGNAGTMLRVVSLFAQRDSWTQTRARTQLKRDEEMTTDYCQFAHRVLGAFQETIMPLEEATHFDLSALARGYFMLGEMRGGFRPLRALIERREIPDRHDMNIALSAMARHSPRAASRMVGRMADQGLRPDGVTLGTVLHEAIVQGDMELVADLLAQARANGVSLSPKTMVSLILARVAVGKHTDKGRLEADVRWAWGVVRAAGEGSVVRTPNVGKRCITACLAVGDAETAFDFWAGLVRDKTEWADGAQRRQRRAIGALVARHCAEGRLDQARGRAMLRALGGCSYR